MKFVAIVLSLFAIAARWVMILIGLPLVAFSLVSDGVHRTPPMWKLWADAEDLDWWSEDEMKWWMYLYVPVVAALAYYSYSHWHALTTIYWIFCTISVSLIVGSKERFTKFWWNAIRNPTSGLAKKFTQPIDEPRPNPDDLVYGGKAKSASRFLRHDFYAEYWYLRAIGNPVSGKKFEFRIGWKFADGTPGFTPTASLRIGN